MVLFLGERLFRLAWDGDLLSTVLAIFLRVVYGSYRRRAREEGHADTRCGLLEPYAPTDMLVQEEPDRLT